jgi:peroxiredoxin
MRDRSAPEVRGSRQIARLRLAAGLGLPVLLFSAPAQSPVAPRHGAVFGGAQAATEHRLQAVPREAKPDFALHDLDGALHELKARAGQVVLVHFFATWCEPCREELSSLTRLIAQQRREPLSVLAINVAEVPARVRRFLEMAPVNFPVLFDADRAVTKAWSVTTLPTTYVLDRTLAPRLFVEGDLDWTRTDVVTAVEQVDAKSN